MTPVGQNQKPQRTPRAVAHGDRTSRRHSRSLPEWRSRPSPSSSASRPRSAARYCGHTWRRGGPRPAAARSRPAPSGERGAVKSGSEAWVGRRGRPRRVHPDTRSAPPSPTQRPDPGALARPLTARSALPCPEPSSVPGAGHRPAPSVPPRNPLQSRLPSPTRTSRPRLLSMRSPENPWRRASDTRGRGQASLARRGPRVPDLGLEGPGTARG